jgi:hypothetical protein
VSDERLTRLFLAESNKTLDFQGNLELAWSEKEDGSFEIQLPIICQVSQEFGLYVRYNPRIPDRVHVGIVFEACQSVYRLDTNDKHRNPGEKLRSGTHLHRPWSKISGETIADFIDGVPNETWQAVNWFLERAKIVEIPEAYWSAVPQIVPSDSLITGR